jgi:glycosyltransferase involved in cell wall biosynthesis
VHTTQSRATFLAPGTTRLALTPARLSVQKGHKFLLEAAVRLPEVTFLLAGEGPERAALEQQARALNLGSRVKFLGYRQDVAELLALCDLVVLPSICEGLPLCVLEAMAAGRPVVATSLPGTAEAVAHGRTGLLVPPADPPALAEAIQKLADDEGLSRAFGSAGADHVRRNFSLANMVDSVTAMYLKPQ